MDKNGAFEMRDRAHSTANRIMSFAVTRGYIGANPVVKLDHDAAGFEQRRQKQRAAIVQPVAFGELLRKIDGYVCQSDISLSRRCAFLP